MDDHALSTENQPQDEDYAAPTLIDLGSFEELTQFNPSATVTDAELGSL